MLSVVTALVVLPTAMLGAQQVVELPRRDQALALPMEEVYRVGGALEEEVWEIFGDLGGPSSLAFDGRGNLYVFDRDNFRVVVVDDAGELIREFGQEGEGPGEWRMPLSMTVLRDGHVVITDIGHRAYMVYGPDGELARTVPVDMSSGGFAIGSMQPDPRGGHLYSNAGGGFQVRVNTTGGGQADIEPGRAIERLSLEDGSKTRFFTAWEPPRGEAQDNTIIRGGGAGFRMAGGGPRTFEPRLHVGVLSDGGLAVVDSSTYAVKMVGPDGRLRRVIRRPSEEPRRVTGRVEEREKERRLEELEAGEGPQMRIMVGGPGGAQPISDDQIREMQKSQIEQMTFYHEIPVVSRMTAGWGGKLWIERAPEAWWEDGPVDVVSPAGEYLGTVAASGPGIPDAFGPGGLVAYMERDELDVPTIVVRRLPVAVR